MNKFFGIIGAVCFALAVALGYLADFAGDSLVAIAVAVFGATVLIVNAVEEAKKADRFTWKTVACIVLSCIAGVLCCIGGLSQSIFATVSGAVIALMTIIFGVMYAKKGE
jgi:hypothetical protein